jgi:uncharacterized membrane protein YqhA
MSDRETAREITPESETTDTATAKSNRRTAEIARKTTAYTRFIATIPAIGFFIAATVMAVGTLLNIVYVSIEFFTDHGNASELAIEFVEYADLFLLSIVLYILALGLVTLFITDQLPLPEWLTFRDFDDLKERLVSVIGAMLAVYFLGYVLKGGDGLDALYLGLAVAAVLIALTFFVRSVLMKGGHH